MSLPDYTTQPLSVSTESIYQYAYSKPLEDLYVFAYRIKISNQGKVPAKLLRRHWIVTNAAGQVREVEGEGVVGQQPLIMPGQSHEYVSWIQLSTPLGAMEGSYIMERPTSSPNETEEFSVPVPRFVHVAPELYN
ncbi:MAG: Co2+/Mg2+ efflux protein ApaG [Bacteroidota bacterium]